MAKKKDKAAALDMPLLTQVVAATAANAFIYTNASQHKPLIDAGFVEVNDAFKDPSDPTKLATRATPAGVAAAGKGAGAVVGGIQTTAAAITYALDVGIAMPAQKPRGGGGFGARPEIYPFSKMEIGQSFFYPATAEKPEPETTFASTVSSATRRYDEPVLNADGTAIMEEKMVAVKGDDGKITKDGNGKVIRQKAMVQKMKHRRVFTIRAVDETAQGRGKGARIWRVA